MCNLIAPCERINVISPVVDTMSLEFIFFTRVCREKEKHALELKNKELQQAMVRLESILENKEKLLSTKDSTQKSLHTENGSLQSRFVCPIPYIL